MKRLFQTLMSVAIVGLLVSCSSDSESAKSSTDSANVETKSVTEIESKPVETNTLASSKLMESPKFEEIDANNDGKIDEKECNDFRADRKKEMTENGHLAEMKKMMGEMKSPVFSDMDTDGNGTLSKEELESAQKKHHDEMKVKMKEAKGDMKCGEGKCGEGKCGGK